MKGTSQKWLKPTYPTHNNLLPHLHTSIHDHFPSASACPALCEDDVPEDTTLEEVGVRIGMGEEAQRVRLGKDLLVMGRTLECPALILAGQRQRDRVHKRKEKGHCGCPPPEEGFVRLEIVEVEESDEEECVTRNSILTK